LNYLLGSGYFSQPNSGSEWFFKLWWDNIHKYSTPKRVVIFSMGGHSLKYAPGDWFTVSGNLGNVGELLSKSKPYPYVGNGVAVCALALMAYSEEMDFVYHEQDLLAFGHVVETMYKECEGAGMIIGRQKSQPCANSLMLVKHHFIPSFVSWYMSSEAECDPENISEHKFARWQEKVPNEIRYYSFGYDRDRPFNIDDPVWYAQKFSVEELLLLKEKGLISFDSIPDNVKRFSNCENL